MFAIKQAFLTPLVKWYLEHGLVITKIYQVVEFKPLSCFNRFAQQVTDDRRAGSHVNIYKITCMIKKYNFMVVIYTFYL